MLPYAKDGSVGPGLLQGAAFLYMVIIPIILHFCYFYQLAFQSPFCVGHHLPDPRSDFSNNWIYLHSNEVMESTSRVDGAELFLEQRHSARLHVANDIRQT